MPTKKGPNYDKINLNKSGYTSHYYKSKYYKKIETIR